MRCIRLLFLACILVVVAGCRDGGPSLLVERIEPATATGVNVPAAWLPLYRDALAPALGEGARQLDADSPDTAAASVRGRRARFALTTPAAARDLATDAIDAVPVALTVPLTFAVEELTADQARALLAGRIRDWHAVGGPALPVAIAMTESTFDAESVRRVLGEEPAGLRTSEVGAAAGALWVVLGDGESLGRKALRVEGALPGEAGYPLVDRRVVAGQEHDRPRIEALAGRLRAEIAARRPVAITFDAVGDVMLGREVGRLIASRGAAFPFERVQPVLAGADVRFANLEIALTERGSAAAKDYVFRAPPASVAALTLGGFNLVSVANNHTLDYGAVGLADTIDALDRAGIAHAGAGRTADEAHAPAIITLKGLRLALLAYVNVPNDGRSGFVAASMAATAGRPGVAWATVEAVRRDVQAAKERADLVVVSLHTGNEYVSTPNPLQRELAHAAVDAGAALVLGAHPHVLQGVEFYQGAPIIYSLGNFVFDLDDDDRRQPGLPTLLTLIFRVTLTASGARGVRFIPAMIDPREGRPIPVAGAEARPVLDRMYTLTNALN